jgi:L-threonylcarbamoyladenylate synthase
MCNEQIKQINSAIHFLKMGGIIAYPTESVYGLGCDPFNEDAVKKLIRLKDRDPDKGLILIASDFLQLRPLLEGLSPKLEEQILKTWPGAITWLWPAKESTSSLLKGKQSTLAIRVTAHPLAKKLCTLFGGAIVSTSANVSGEEAPRNYEAISKRLSKQIDYIVKGNTGEFTSPTEIRDTISGRIIRPAK